MKVCIAEKPSVAKEIASVLGAGARKDGYFEGNGYQVTWTFGHLCTLKEPHEYNENWKWWNINTLPMLPPRFGIKVLANKGVEKQFKTIATLVLGASEIINCGDAGQEGELIQRWVLSLAKNTKPLKRLWISSLTEAAIKEGFKNLKEGSEFDKLYAAGNSRAVGDWLLGMNATRLYTLKYGQGKQVLSIGRVQTPTLALIVNRQLEIEDFKSQTFWELKTKYREVIFNSVKGRFLDQEKAEKALEAIIDFPFSITGVEIKKAKEAPPRLFDLTSLQVDCNKKFGYSADDTLKTIQTLYEKKFVTYPRVDTTYLSNDLYPKISGILKSLNDYQQLAAPLLQKQIKKSSKVFNDNKVTDHHAIIPTDVTARGLGGYEANVYDMIVRRFIAAFYADCEVSNTTVKGQAADTEFKATGRQILSEGWRIVYQKETLPSNEDEQEDTQLLPSFNQGESGPHLPLLQEKQTQPPKPFTEALLLRAMEMAGKTIDDEELREAMKDNGIGRPSTRAAVIETLFKRNYIKKERKVLVATPTGIALIKSIHNDLLKSAELTGQWEFKLRQIEKGEYEALVFLEEMKQMVSNLVLQVKNETGSIIPVENSDSKEKDSKKHKKATSNSITTLEDLKCPKCKVSHIAKGKTAIGCRNYNECGFKIPFNTEVFQLNEDQIHLLLINGKIEFIKENSPGFIELNKSFELVFKQTKEKKKAAVNAVEFICPKCKANLIKGARAWGCIKWKSGCDFRLPFEFMGKKLSSIQIDLLLSKGETKPIKNILTLEGTSKNGKFYLDEKKEIGFK
ncbi:MAG: DNA topoisomerase 3 [Bacteroidetes bacterium]|nr:DNA topoisomerase 3 [Bacteroidota bacterium]HET6243940.1 DNA topoisomerase 3 [Bacteroidia bacterium]